MKQTSTTKKPSRKRRPNVAFDRLRRGDLVEHSGRVLLIEELYMSISGPCWMCTTVTGRRYAIGSDSWSSPKYASKFRRHLDLEPLRVSLVNPPRGRSAA
jgi:hypothetical protein